MTWSVHATLCTVGLASAMTTLKQGLDSTILPLQNRNQKGPSLAQQPKTTLAWLQEEGEQAKRSPIDMRGLSKGISASDHPCRR
jgi:hypothetical protein